MPVGTFSFVHQLDCFVFHKLILSSIRYPRRRSRFGWTKCIISRALRLQNALVLNISSSFFFSFFSFFILWLSSRIAIQFLVCLLLNSLAGENVSDTVREFFRFVGIYGIPVKTEAEIKQERKAAEEALAAAAAAAELQG